MLPCPLCCVSLDMVLAAGYSWCAVQESTILPRDWKCGHRVAWYLPLSWCAHLHKVVGSWWAWAAQTMRWKPWTQISSQNAERFFRGHSMNGSLSSRTWEILFQFRQNLAPSLKVAYGELLRILARTSELDLWWIGECRLVGTLVSCEPNDEGRSPHSREVSGLNSIQQFQSRHC